MFLHNIMIRLANLRHLIALPICIHWWWKCALTDDGNYHVGAIRSKLDSMEPANNEEIIPWIHEIPIKVSTFVWRANLVRIPSNNALNRRRVPGIEDRCLWCSKETEDAAHILLHCPMAASVWELVFKWCEISQPQIQVIGDLISFVKKWGNNKKRRNNLISVCFGGTIWLLWKSRCDLMFKNVRTSLFRILDGVKSTVYSWLKHRRASCNYGWNEWCSCPLSCVWES